MAKQKGLEVARRLIIHVKQPGVIIVTAIGGRRMIAEAEREVADFTLEKVRRVLQNPPLSGYLKRR